MAHEDIALLWRVIERWNAGDEDLTLAVLDPEIELQTPFSSLAGRPYRGIAGFREWRAEIREQFETWRLDVDEISRLGGDRLLVKGAAHVRGHGSGIELDQPATTLVDVRAGRVLRVRIFLSEEEARTAARRE